MKCELIKLTLFSTAIYTAAMAMLGGGEAVKAQCRTPEIMADAAYSILTRDSRSFTGNFCVDDEILKEEGVTDFSKYNYVESKLDCHIGSLSGNLHMKYSAYMPTLLELCLWVPSIMVSVWLQIQLFYLTSSWRKQVTRRSSWIR